MSTFNIKLKELRKQRNLSQQELAKIIGISKSSINMYERGEREPGIETINAFAEFFDVQTDYLFGKTLDNRSKKHSKIYGKQIYELIESYRIEHGFSSEQIEELLDWDGLYNAIENNSYMFDESIYQMIKNLLKLPNMSIEDVSPLAKTTSSSTRIPVYGRVAAGIPIDAITDIEDYEEITDEMARQGEYAALKIKGNSMLPRFADGDVVIVRLQSDVNTGDIAIVLINGDEATCKKIKKTPEGVMLISTNPEYEPLFFSNKEIEEKPVRIWGKVVELRAKF